MERRQWRAKSSRLPRSARVTATLVAALALGAAPAHAAQFEWNWTRWGNTEALVGLKSTGGTTYVREVTGWCGWGEGADVNGPFRVKATWTPSCSVASAFATSPSSYRRRRQCRGSALIH